MKNLIDVFQSSPIEQQLGFVFWGVCVVMFFSSVLVIVGDVVYKTFKKITL